MTNAARRNMQKLLKKLTVWVSADVHRALKIEAAERRRSMGALIEEALSTRIRFLPRELRKDEKENK